MTASADMISKINSLGQSDFTLVVNLVDFLAKKRILLGKMFLRRREKHAKIIGKMKSNLKKW